MFYLYNKLFANVDWMVPGKHRYFCGFKLRFILIIFIPAFSEFQTFLFSLYGHYIVYNLTFWLTFNICFTIHYLNYLHQHGLYLFTSMPIICVIGDQSWLSDCYPHLTTTYDLQSGNHQTAATSTWSCELSHSSSSPSQRLNDHRIATDLSARPTCVWWDRRRS